MSALIQPSMKQLGVSVLRLGDHGTNKRVWIVNKALQQTFAPGEKVDVNYDKTNAQIRIKKSNSILSNHTVSSRGNGTPIIDLKNQKVGETFGDGVEKIEVLYFKDEIVIKVAKLEIFKQKRTEKKGLNTFELFCGAGTLSHQFKKAGFNIKGGLELDEDYLALFHENNAGEEIYSINARIEDLHTSYLPKDIDVLLSGIPCTTFSGSNVKLKTALKNRREGKPYDAEEIKKADQGESLTFYVLTAIRAMNPRTVVVEEVVEYSESSASIMLRTVLEHMGYNITETVSSGMHTKRQRWCLVANMGEAVSLENLLPDDGKTIGDMLETSVEDREWKPKEGFAQSRLNEAIGIRSCTPNDVMCNTFTTHSTRGTEPILKHPTEELYSEFTNREIANIHGLGKDFILTGKKTTDRQILGQGVTDAFYHVAQRIKEKGVLQANFMVYVDTFCSRVLVDNRHCVYSSACTIDPVAKKIFGVSREEIDQVMGDVDPTGTAGFDMYIEINGVYYIADTDMFYLEVSSEEVLANTPVGYVA